MAGYEKAAVSNDGASCVDMRLSVRHNVVVALWHPFDPSTFEYEFNEEKLAEHGVAVHEAAEVLWNGFEVRRNKSYKDRYQVVGRTDGGRTLKLIVQRASRRLRVITGWPL